MVSVVIALLSAVGGVLAGLVPALLVSERKRLLHLIDDETKLIAAVDDPHAKANLTRGLRATTKRYAALATQTRVEKLRRRLGLSVVPLYLWSMACGMVLAVSAMGDFTDSTKKWLIVAGGVPMLLGMAVWLLLMTRYFEAKREARAEASKVGKQQELIKELQAKITRLATRGADAGIEIQ